MSILPQNIGDPIADAQRDAEHAAAVAHVQHLANDAAMAEATRRELGETLKVVLGETLIDEMENGYSERTLGMYTSDFRKFMVWCKKENLPYLPATPEVVATYLIEMAGEIPPMASIIRMHSAISHRHQVTQNFNPTADVVVNATMRWLRERFAEAKANGKANGTGTGSAPEASDTGKVH